jgi:hypothetical protein
MSFFDVFQAGVQHFFDAPQLRAPKIPHVVEALVDRVKSAVNRFETTIDRVESAFESADDRVKPTIHRFESGIYDIELRLHQGE